MLRYWFRRAVRIAPAHWVSLAVTYVFMLRARHAGMPPEAAADVQGTLAAARRGAVLLDRIATITGPRRLTPEPVDLPALLEQLATMARPSLGRGIALELDCDLPGARCCWTPGPCRIRC